MIYFVNAHIVPCPSKGSHRPGSQTNYADPPRRFGQGADRQSNSAPCPIICRRPGGLMHIDELQAMSNAAMLKKKVVAERFTFPMFVNRKDAIKVSRSKNLF